MMDRALVGFACVYTPLPLLDAAGFVPWRILPVGDAPDQAGRLLHDNLCPHVKRLLDRAMAADLPPLAGIVFMNSCDAMRRLPDAWRVARPSDRVILVDLPASAADDAVEYFAAELRALAVNPADWGGTSIRDADLEDALRRYDGLASSAAGLRAQLARGELPGGAAALQAAINDVTAGGWPDGAARLAASSFVAPAASAAGDAARPASGVPVFVFGNVLPEPEAFALFESCGARVVADDVCTGSRVLAPLAPATDADPYVRLARGLLGRAPCARTIDPAHPGGAATRVVDAARSCGARGVVAHVAKFCDPYLARLPAIREALREAGLPLLVLEGDCTRRSLGQQRTRIEAFVEMLESR
ncbi:MAG: 2-hydroxyacyl-CoA dehydratase [Deltaproteobacteria bacterium]|nr:2-hydroxyacyl-CoA dehydratase [Deltaproteobacteria bacterium]